MIADQLLDDMRTGDLRTGLLDLIADLPTGLTMVEVGCFKGESTELFLRSGKVKKLYAVDTWGNVRYRLAEEIFKVRFRDIPTQVMQVIKSDFGKAVEGLPKIDFVYIDADHTYDWVRADILNALKVIKRGGIIAGHDYVKRGNVGVIAAVRELLGAPDKIYIDSSWIKRL